MRLKRSISRWSLLGLLILAVAHPQARAGSVDAFHIGIRDDGVYHVAYEDLVAAGLSGVVSAKALRLQSGGVDVPVWVDDGDDGHFGPGDKFQFLGRHRPGSISHFSHFSRWHVYQLSTSDSSAARLSPREVREPTAPATEPDLFYHLEQDKLRVRFKRRGVAGDTPDPWYWLRLSTLDSKPGKVILPPLDPDLADTIRLRIAFRGWSMPRTTKDLPDHQVEISLNGEVIGTGAWDSQHAQVVEIDGLPADALSTNASLEITVPTRLDVNLDPIVDVSLLDWVEVRQSFSGRVGNEPIQLYSKAAAFVDLQAEESSAYLVVDDEGFKTRVKLVDTDSQRVSISAGTTYIVREGRTFPPAWIAADHPSQLREQTQQADYLMVAHSSLLEAVEPLAEFHRQRGLSVKLIDVQDIYDEFAFGNGSPQAIRDFVQYAHSHWKSPAPRFVLLVGDASWDVSNEKPHFRLYADWTYKNRESKRFLNNSSTSYAETRFRNLIPTWPVETYEGLAASDNAFVAIDGDDFYPDLAVGRFPVTDAEEVRAIVVKTIGYAEHSEVGPWRRSVLWVTNEQSGFQRMSDYLSDKAAEKGLAATKVYPAKSDQDNLLHQQNLTQELGSGKLIVHFLGHGGRYIWRTGPPDIQKNHDLFTLGHIESLMPTRQLPLVLSMTCYSAPFDHPTADSIGEKFLRTPDRGAVAVLAASWRNNPTRRFSERLITELTRPGVPIGEAVAVAKQKSNNRIMVETYNLLGDPALVLAFPSKTIRLKLGDKGRIRARLTEDSPRRGEAIVDWVDSQGNVMESRRLDVNRRSFSAAPGADVDPERISGARVYFWNSRKRVDALGSITLDPKSSSSPMRSSSF